MDGGFGYFKDLFLNRKVERIGRMVRERRIW